MPEQGVLVVGGNEVRALVRGLERELMRAVESAYLAHAAGDSSLPHSAFLRFPGDERNRIIALPAYLGQDFDLAGIKWISSFPGNAERGMERASAVIVLNSAETGRPRAIMEGSIISAKRTAASAALAAARLHEGRAERVGLVGCGLINFEIARFLLAAIPRVRAVLLYDERAENAHTFARKCRELSDAIDISVAGDVNDLLRSCELVSLATTAPAPHISELPADRRPATLLHISLRDLTPELILSCRNVVDDVEHVCRAQTSVHLAEQLVGHREFINCTLADVLRGGAPAVRGGGRTIVFSPFGLGVLDLAVGKLVFERAKAAGVGSEIHSFFPDHWAEGAQARPRSS